MKKTLFITLFLFFSISAALSQWISPGNGTVYSLRDLVEITEGCVTYQDSVDAYFLHADLTIAPNDCLKVTASDCQTTPPDAIGIISEGDVMINIQGSIQIEIEGMYVYFLPWAEENHLRIRIENSSAPCVFNHTRFTYISGVQIIESEVTFQHCLFQNIDMEYATGAVTYMNCDPVFNDCVFQGNYGSAISSGANVTGSPQITRCDFRYNVLSKENRPQLNLGPGGEDTIRIVNSRVIGLYPLVGGISISDLMQTGSTKVLLKGNFIADNRYGYNQQGYTIDALIVDNEFVCNQIEENPMNGGSGISIYGASTECKAKIRHNLIKGNIWGVTVIAQAMVDMGTADDYGHNMIFNNHNNSTGTQQEYALYVNGVNDVTAIGNYWGGDNEEDAESVIYHRPDLGEEYGLVSYSPILTENHWTVEETMTENVSIYPNPTNGLVTLRMDQVQGFDYEIYNLQGQQLLKGHSKGSETIIDLSAYPAGLYVVSIIHDSSNIPVIRKIIR